MKKYKMKNQLQRIYPIHETSQVDHFNHEPLSIHTRVLCLIISSRSNQSKNIPIGDTEDHLSGNGPSGISFGKREMKGRWTQDVSLLCNDPNGETGKPVKPMFTKVIK
jgi:hypothetical protein